MVVVGGVEVVARQRLVRYRQSSRRRFRRGIWERLVVVVKVSLAWFQGCVVWVIVVGVVLMVRILAVRSRTSNTERRAVGDHNDKGGEVSVVASP